MVVVSLVFFIGKKSAFLTCVEHINRMLGSYLIANLLLTINGPRRVITCFRGPPEETLGYSSSLRIGREQHVPDSSNHSPCLIKLFNSRQTTQQTTQHTTQHNTAQHSTAQHSTAQHSTAQHST